MRFNLSSSLALWLGLLQSAAALSIETVPQIETRATKNKVQTWPIPEGVPTSSAFSIKIRSPGGKWRDVQAYQPEVVESNTTTGSTSRRKTSMIRFDFDGTVEVSATYNGTVDSARLRPDSLGLEATVTASKTVDFTLTEPQDVVLQVNDDIFHGALHVFTSRIEKKPPRKGDANVIYYGPGFHQETKPLNISSGTTVYLAGGAVLSVPAINFVNATGASLRGRGVLRATSSIAISVIRSEDILVEGLTSMNILPRSYQSTNVTFRDLRIFSAVTWGDGIDIFCSSNVLIDGVFLRTSDDSVALYNHRDD